MRRPCSHLLLAISLLAASTASAAASGCEFVAGFAAIHAAIPNESGDCLDNQATMLNGDAQQHTANGLLVWRKVDNWTAFTNGSLTWIAPTASSKDRTRSTFPGSATTPA